MEVGEDGMHGAKVTAEEGKAVMELGKRLGGLGIAGDSAPILVQTGRVNSRDIREFWRQ
ncbi:hypothetical protein ACP4OV_012629 [Aristida adscensionis]